MAVDTARFQRFVAFRAVALNAFDDAMTANQRKAFRVLFAVEGKIFPTRILVTSLATGCHFTFVNVLVTAFATGRSLEVEGSFGSLGNGLVAFDTLGFCMLMAQRKAGFGMVKPMGRLPL